MGFALHRLISFAPLGRLTTPLRRIMGRRPWQQPLPASGLQLVHPTVALSSNPAPDAPPHQGNPQCAHTSTLTSSDPPGPPRPVRVLRGQHSGCLVLAGRMADVCAELNRLAEQ
ncbi:hypothetical protein MASR1M59_18850 [Melaminivora sp.]